MMEVETGMTEVTASEVAGVPEAEVEAEVTMMAGTAGTTLGIVIDGALTMILGVGAVAAVPTVVIEVDMVMTVLMHVHLILLAAATTNRRPRQLLTINLLPYLLVHRYVFVALESMRQSL